MTIVYKYTCIVTDKVYVGKTDKDLRKRHIDHCSRARIGKKTPFYNAIRKYGADAFNLEVLSEVESEFGNFIEILFITALKANDRQYGYNVSDGGEGALGVRLSAKTIANLKLIAKTRPRRKYTKEHRIALSEKMLGNQFAVGAVRSDEFKRNAREKHLGQKASPEAVLKRLKSRYGSDYTPKVIELKGRPTKAKGFDLPGWRNGGNLAKLQASRTPEERSAQASKAAKAGHAKRRAEKDARS